MVFKNQIFMKYKGDEINLNFISYFNKCDFGKYEIYYNDVRHIGIAEDRNKKIIMIGTFYDPIKNILSANEIVANIFKESNKYTDVIDGISLLSGRFWCLFYINEQYYIMNDTCSLKKIYYTKLDESVYLTSNVTILFKLNLLKLNIDEETYKIINSKKFKSSENAWFSNEWYDKRVKMLLPNWYLNLEDLTIKHIEYTYDGLYSINEIMKECAKILRNSIGLISSIDKCMMPVTAGRDSRLLLAASKDYINKINYYIFKFNNMDMNDLKIPTEIFKCIERTFNIYETNSLSDEFLNVFNEHQILPRILPKTENIQWHYINSKDQNIININGNCAGIFKNQYSNKKIKNLIHNYNYFETFFEYWEKEMLVFCKDSEIEITDMFYWELRMGIWGNQYPLEQDIAIEELSPFNNRYLLYMLLKTPISYRSEPKYTLFTNLNNIMWPDLNKFMYNPLSIKGKLKSIIKRIIKK